MTRMPSRSSTRVAIAASRVSAPQAPRYAIGANVRLSNFGGFLVPATVDAVQLVDGVAHSVVSLQDSSVLDIIPERKSRIERETDVVTAGGLPSLPRLPVRGSRNVSNLYVEVSTTRDWIQGMHSRHCTPRV